MIKRFCVYCMLIAIAISTTVYATGDPTYNTVGPMHTKVDVAQKNVIFGWSDNCNTGNVPTGFMLWRRNLDGSNLTNVPIDVYIGARGDAAAWLAAQDCHGGVVDAHIGWALVPRSPEPIGTYIYTVMVGDIPNSWYCGSGPNGIWCDWATNVVDVTVGD